MKIEDILAEWEIDSTIDDTELALENIKIPKLHHKYLRIMSNERLVLRAFQEKFLVLKKDKRQFYLHGPVGGEPENWSLPYFGKVHKPDIDLYIDSDEDMQNLETKIIIQKQKIDEVESILKTIMYRNQLLRNIIDWKKFQAGM